jgi:hypothetical protein
VKSVRVVCLASTLNPSSVILRQSVKLRSVRAVSGESALNASSLTQPTQAEVRLVRAVNMANSHTPSSPWHEKEFK